jgi:hypothetical protein
MGAGAALHCKNLQAVSPHTFKFLIHTWTKLDFFPKRTTHFKLNPTTPPSHPLATHSLFAPLTEKKEKKDNRTTK